MESLNKTAQDLDTELDSLSQEAAAFRARMQQVNQQLQADRNAVRVARQSFLDKMVVLAQSVQGLEDGLKIDAADYLAGIGKAKTAVGHAVEQLKTEQGHAVESFSSAVPVAHAAASQVHTFNGACDAAAQARHGTLVALEHEGQSIADEACALLEQVGTEYVKSEAGTQAFFADVHAQAAQLRAAMTTHHEQALGSARGFVRDCLVLIESVAAQNVQKPIDAHCEQLRQQVHAQVRDALRMLLQDVDRAITDVENNLLGTSSATRGKRQELAPVRQALEGVMDPLTGALDSVKSTAQAVGFNP